MQRTEIGEFSVVINEQQFNFNPTLKNIGKIADSKEILTVFNSMYSPIVPMWIKIERARLVLLHCCDNKNIDNHLIKVVKMKPRLNHHSISINDQIVVATALLNHGLVGIGADDYEGSKKAKGKEMLEFDVNKIASEAQIHFNMSEADALSLTMSKFRHLLAAKFPAESTQNKKTAPSLSDHQAAMREFYEAEAKKNKDKK